ncbi:MAG: hypothetical protein U9N44_07710, partial [Chloroflexota bacterium]|nr:hypothetical protein [Chloroflexota bacterium]
WDIYVMDIETGEITRLTENYVIDAHPDWSPDGSQIVFGSFRDAEGNPSGAADIFTVSVEGTDLTRLTDSIWEDNDPEWSPDGTMIAFKSNRNTQQAAREEIFVMDADGSSVVRLTTTTGWQSDHDPSWNTDGSSVLFSRYEGERPWTDSADLSVFQWQWQELIPWNVYEVDLSGIVTKLTSVEYAAGLPVFSIDGSSVLFLRLDFIISDDQLVGSYHRLILMDTDGNNQQQLIPDDSHTSTMEYFDW